MTDGVRAALIERLRGTGVENEIGWRGVGYLADALLPVVRWAQAAALSDAADDMEQEALRAAKSTGPEQANAYVNAAQRLRVRADAPEGPAVSRHRVAPRDRG